jgi:formylglycine-generating enzyme required for sulfatase activity
VIGNVWQHTETPTMPFNGFRTHPIYDDFSVPTFDTRHNMIMGGSWISTGNEATRHAR